MKRDELVDGSWYLIKKKDKWVTGEYKRYLMFHEGFETDIEIMKELNFEWARISPEEIFKSPPRESDDGE